MKKQLRTAAMILAVIFALSVILSLSFLSVEADHDCTGEDCPICAVIALCKNIIRNVVTAVAAVTVAVAVGAVSSYAISAVSRDVTETPFTLKVRLLN
jgi:hypothetical protein